MKIEVGSTGLKFTPLAYSRCSGLGMNTAPYNNSQPLHYSRSILLDCEYPYSEKKICTFSIDFHYGRKFIKKNDLQYVGGDNVLVANIDVDKVSFFEVVDMIVNVEADVWKTLYYVELPLTLKNRLRKMKSDNDRLEMVGVLENKHRIYMYVDNEGIDIFDQEESANNDESSNSLESDGGPQVGEATI